MCLISGRKYVGENENTINIRCRGHDGNIWNMTDNPVTNCYGSDNHTIENYMICAVDKERDKNRRSRLEETLMILVDTLCPKGLNSRW